MNDRSKQLIEMFLELIELHSLILTLAYWGKEYSSIESLIKKCYCQQQNNTTEVESNNVIVICKNLPIKGLSLDAIYQLISIGLLGYDREGE